jgi:hypothetical protein
MGVRHPVTHADEDTVKLRPSLKLSYLCDKHQYSRSKTVDNMGVKHYVVHTADEGNSVKLRSPLKLILRFLCDKHKYRSKTLDNVGVKHSLTHVGDKDN